MKPIRTISSKDLIIENNKLYDTQTGEYNKQWPVSDIGPDLPEDDKLAQWCRLHEADRRSETWFRIAIAGWASAIVFAAIVIWLTVIWP